MTTAGKPIAIIYPSGVLKKDEIEKKRFFELFASYSLDAHDLVLKNDSENGYSAGTAMERAALTCHALTNRKYTNLIAARGGYGSTELIPFLENMLPPVLPSKSLFGFSDASFLGVYLALRHPNFTYIHANNAFSDEWFTGDPLDIKYTIRLLKQDIPAAADFDLTGRSETQNLVIEGLSIPLNLTLAESLSSLRNISFDFENILFFEDLNEDLYKILRKLNALKNAGFFEKTNAIVLGDFKNCTKADGTLLADSELCEYVQNATSIPTFASAFFGHSERRFPIVCLAASKITTSGRKSTLTLGFLKQSTHVKTQFPATAFSPALHSENRVHFTGIGGTGMAAVAGLFKESGYIVTGSDNPIYPPMDKVLKDLNIAPSSSYKDQNITEARPDFVVLANALSRGNPELEFLLKNRILINSFPSALRKHFLHKSLNVVVSGTHGKTTTTSLIAQAFEHLGLSPSFLIGGVPNNFSKGFRISNKNLFILEGDEYDTAFFDKGPKFLHYDPRITLINNIEFDHADIYANVEAIEDEFLLLARTTKENCGVVVANGDDERSFNILEKCNALGISFGTVLKQTNFVQWILQDTEFNSSGMTVTILAPNGETKKARLKIFGRHNALNAVASLSVIHAHAVLSQNLGLKTQTEFSLAARQFTPAVIDSWVKALESFTGVKRRFELVADSGNITVFDDFAHHPTAINTTLEGFRKYMLSTGRKGRLIACFEPKNATMRRNTLSRQLAESFQFADLVFIGKVAHDARLESSETLDGNGVAKACGKKASYFDDNEKLCEHLSNIAKPQDTIVFMSSGSFDNLPRKLSGLIHTRE